MAKGARGCNPGARRCGWRSCRWRDTAGKACSERNAGLGMHCAQLSQPAMTEWPFWWSWQQGIRRHPSCFAGARFPCAAAASPWPAGQGAAAIRSAAAPCRGSARQSNTATITRNAFMSGPERRSRRATRPVLSWDSCSGILVHRRRRCPAPRTPGRQRRVIMKRRSPPGTDAAQGMVFRGEYPLGGNGVFSGPGPYSRPDEGGLRDHSGPGPASTHPEERVP